MRWIGAIHRKVGRDGIAQPHAHVLLWPVAERAGAAPSRLPRDRLRAVKNVWAREVFGAQRAGLAAEKTAQRDLALAAAKQAALRDPLEAGPAERLERLAAAMPERGRVALTYMPAEVKRLCRHLSYRTGKTPETKLQEVALVFLVALHSGMRAGEILSLGKSTLDLHRRVARIAQHKTAHLTGRPREVPLTRAAVRLLRPVASRDACFSLTSASLDALFRKARDNLLIEDLHFHDTRGEALTRLSRRVDVMTLARISGHKDLRILMAHYYRETPEQIAARI